MIDIELVDVANPNIRRREWECQIAGDGLPPRIRRVERGGAADRKHLARDGLGLRDHLEDQPEFVALDPPVGL